MFQLKQSILKNMTILSCLHQFSKHTGSHGPILSYREELVALLVAVRWPPGQILIQERTSLTG